MENTAEFACTQALRRQMRLMQQGILSVCPEFDPRLADLCATYALSRKVVACGAAEADNLALFRRVYDGNIACLEIAAYRAARLGSHNIMRHLIEEHGLLDQSSYLSIGLFREAVNRHQQAVSEYLLPHIRPDQLTQAIVEAASNGNIELILRLAYPSPSRSKDNCADMRMCGSAVAIAAKNDDIPTICVLLDAGAPACQAAFIVAAQTNSEDALECLLERAHRHELRGTIRSLTTYMSAVWKESLLTALQDELDRRQ